jgi:excisionase family DNA binding protein
MWMTLEEVARYLQVSKETIYKMVQRGKIPASKVGSQWRFNKSAVDQWLISQSNTFITTTIAEATNE